MKNKEPKDISVTKESESVDNKQEKGRNEIDQDTLLDHVEKIEYTLDKGYLSNLSSKDYLVLDFSNSLYKSNGEKIEYKDRYHYLRMIQITRWVFDKKEPIGECLKNVLSLFCDGKHSIGILIERTIQKVNFYFVLKNNVEDIDKVVEDEEIKLLRDSIIGNFPGSEAIIIKDNHPILPEDGKYCLWGEVTNIEVPESGSDVTPRVTLKEIKGDKCVFEVLYGLGLMEYKKVEIPSTKVEKTIEDILCFDKYNSVSTLINTPSEYSKNHITQGLDKLLDGIVPSNESEEYSVLFLCESISKENIKSIIEGYEDLATAIHPYLEYQFNVGKSETNTKGEMTSIANTKTISDSITKTQSVSIGLNSSQSNTRGESSTNSLTESTSMAKTQSDTVGVSVGGSNGFLSASVSYAHTLAKTVAESVAKGFAKTISSSVSRVLGSTVGYGYSFGKTHTVANANTNTSGQNSSISIGEHEHTTYSYKSYLVENILKKINKTIERINVANATGVWKYSTYVFASDSTKSKNIANFLRATSQGNESYIDPCVIQEWSKSKDSDSFNNIKDYVSFIKHPVFYTSFKYDLLDIDIDATDKEEKKEQFAEKVKFIEDEKSRKDIIQKYNEAIDNDNKEEEQKILQSFINVEPKFVESTSICGTNELSNVIAFPNKSLPGLPILNGCKFGREPHSINYSYNGDIDIANAYHMYKEDKNVSIKLSSDELTKHVFITGSTGSGKSNTVYKLIEELCINKNMHFLVIEPAKGEYSRALSKHKDEITTYSTNTKFGEQLRINPFAFPKEMHVLEHLDRLVEIFNVCWPMYAAMPAILKESMERAYEYTGWDLKTSRNKYNHCVYPSFDEVLSEIRNTLKSSDYSEDNKSDYTGALVTRVKSLTNGINGQVFTNNEISSENLFDKNVIVDLSRIGSSETKSLIMGILILKLQEYRMKFQESNKSLQHITILEEAHNILKRTPSEQIQESSNLIGKSVEMISNAIAEMRTYGEGFIIVDQAPGLLDLSTIRNTNTKIIMRLPSDEDRKLICKSIGLSDEQTDEVSRFECGVAVISQSNWIEPVLCKIKEYKKDEKELNDNNSNTKNEESNDSNPITENNYYKVRVLIRNLLSGNIDSEKLEKYVNLDIKNSIKVPILHYFSSNNEEDKKEALDELLYKYFKVEDISNKYKEPFDDVEFWHNKLNDELRNQMIGWVENIILKCIHLVVQTIPQRIPRLLPLYVYEADLIKKGIKNGK